MSHTDAMTDLRAAAARIEEALNVHDARYRVGDHGWQRMWLNAARLDVGRAMENLAKYDRTRLPAQEQDT